MPQILDRGEGHAKRSERLAKQKKGPGVFVYLGTAMAIEETPTPLLTDEKKPVFTEDGMPAFDAAGRQVFKPAGIPQRDSRGHIIMGGVPKRKEVKLDPYVLRGVSFPSGKPVKVDSAALALKLRCMAHFEEVDASVAKAEAPAEKALEDLSKAELLALASEKGVEVHAGATKAAIIELIKGPPQA